jgi:glucose/arabinose dehydrogenase
MASPSATESVVPSGFQETVVFSGLTQPTAVKFSPDGRVFVAEKSGLIKIFSSLSDTTPTVFADLRTNVYNFWDRGLLGLALDPGFPASPYVYVLYAYDHVLGSSAPAPRWGTPGVTSDPCPTPPGPTTDGCVVSGRLSRVQASGDSMTGSEQVMIEDWCQQYPSHSIGEIVFGPDGALYASAGDGASFTFTDWGQDGSPANPCGDPPSGVGTALTPPTAEGGNLRSQDLRTSGDPAGLDGTIIRVDPATGNALPSNPFAASSDPNVRRVIAYGLRNPFRFTFRPGTSEIWLGDVGQTEWEEINRIPSSSDGVAENFGWPCYEGPNRQSAFDAANLNICENLYAESGADTKPFFSYRHSEKVVSSDACPVGSSSISGVSFAFSGGSSPYPSDYDSALFFADYSRDCIWVMKKGANGVPAPGLIQPFVEAAANPVALERGPNGAIYYADFDGGTIRRIDYVGSGGVPVNTSPPVVSGSAVQGQVLSSSAGSWSNSPTSFAYQWLRCDSSGGGCVQVAGATSSSYTVVAADVGSTLRSRVVASNGSGASAPAQSVQTAVVVAGGGGGVPVNSALPVVSGFAGQGQVLTSSPGSWTNAPTSFAYQWLRCDSSGGACVGIAGATSAGYVPVVADVGSSMRVSVTASNGSGASAPAQSAASAVVAADKALGKPATASSVQAGTTWTPDKAVDGNSNTRWAAAGGDNQWWQVDLGSVQQVDRVALNWEAAYASSYKFQVSLDGVSFTDVASVSNSAAGWKMTTFAAVSARYVRWQGITRGTPYTYSFWDAQVFGAGTSGNSPPTPVITSPASSTTWSVGQVISFAGSASDPEDGALASAALSWSLVMHHCPSNCHTHQIQTFDGVASGSFSAPDHEYPSHLELKLTATDSGGASATTSVLLNPRTVQLTLATVPGGLTVALNSSSGTAPLAATVIEGSSNSISAPDQSLGGTSYTFSAWSDGGAQNHNVTANSTATYTATFASGGGGGVPVNSAPPVVSGFAGQGQVLTSSAGSWTNAPTSFAYQWLRCDSSGGGCAQIAGATSAGYVPVVADVGSSLRVSVTASNGSGASMPADSGATAVVVADLALGRPATASSVQAGTTHTPDKAVDGSSSTRWAASGGDNQWWQVDLGSVRQVDRVALNWEAAYASSYKFQVSLDGVSFTDVASVSNSAAGWKMTTFAAVSARYVRWVGITRGTPYTYSFWDAQVFDGS